MHSFTSLRQLDDLLELGPGEAVSFNRTSWTRLEEISDRSAWFSAHWARAERGEITSVPPGLDVRTDPDAVETEMFLFRPEE